jgi:superfamily II DNA or RNA helicase
MPDGEQTELFSEGNAAARGRYQLRAVHGSHEAVELTWTHATTGAVAARVEVKHCGSVISFYPGSWRIEIDGETEVRRSGSHPNSIRPVLGRLRKQFPVADSDVALVIRTKTGVEESVRPVDFPAGCPPWRWIERQVAAVISHGQKRFEELVNGAPQPGEPIEVEAARNYRRMFTAPVARCELRIILNYASVRIEMIWALLDTEETRARVQVYATEGGELAWELTENGATTRECTAIHRAAIYDRVKALQNQFGATEKKVSVCAMAPDPERLGHLVPADPPPWPPGQMALEWLADQILIMAEAGQSSPLDHLFPLMDSGFAAFLEREARRDEKERKKREEIQARIRQSQQRQREEQQRRQRERQARAAAQARAQSKPAQKPAAVSAPPPEVPVNFDLPPLEVQETMLPLTDLRGYFLRERAALWWVSNQSDDLLALPYCRIQKLDYQIRTALRVIGPLRGRALLSDEVGLGKTIEAGLVLKEYLTRGMVARFLVLTVPSLVDQWAEELEEKFNLATITTNISVARSDPEKFWRGHPGIVASLHTLKQPAHLAVAQTVNWDMLIIDEAHYLRNRTSQAWQAINALPRQFLLLLTATPVQNSLEELYNLVTLLQPGQLPSPKEFRARFIDPKRPHQPREPEELRRLLGQVMIRNTRANAGVDLPPRRAETVIFEPTETERAFWESWETEFRLSLARLKPAQSSFWGRLLLQAAGSSPAAWRSALESFPETICSRAWSEQAPLEESWRKKCQLLEPLTKGEGGVVIFSQFLETQAAIAEHLRKANLPAFVVNGQTPPAHRQPITEKFRQQGGALLLTHSGTEGRNLQFSHRLVNFDLPWNPMEIEQRIGRLHRLGQQHPVRIYNLVQAGTLQEHLLEILQEKLNLFELVVGETGLILGDRFSSDEFAEEILKRWRDSEGRLAEAMQSLGEELAAARGEYSQIKQLDETLFAKDYESL